MTMLPPALSLTLSLCPVSQRCQWRTERWRLYLSSSSSSSPREPVTTSSTSPRGTQVGWRASVFVVMWRTLLCWKRAFLSWTFSGFLFLLCFSCFVSLPALYSLLAIMLTLVFCHYTPPHSYSPFAVKYRVSLNVPLQSALLSSFMMYWHLLSWCNGHSLPQLFPLIHNHHLCLS